MIEYNEEENTLTTDTYLAAAGLSTDELVLGGIGMMRKSILDMLDALISSGIAEMSLTTLRTIIAESELELLPVSREDYLKGTGGGNG